MSFPVCSGGSESWLGCQIRPLRTPKTDEFQTDSFTPILYVHERSSFTDHFRNIFVLSSDDLGLIKRMLILDIGNLSIDGNTKTC